ncbi:MAG: hypothetical protein H5T69_17635 [Chloroflexi bacterium]|nr:hypothetical protein [Chloroflexota bacterium]
MLSTWKATFLERAALIFQEDEHSHADQERIGELERLAGRLALELEIAQKASPILTSRLAETAAEQLLLSAA